MSKKLRNILRATKEYEEVCMTCKDEILTYPSISGRTNYTDEEVEELTLKQIIDNLQAKEQENEKLKTQILSLQTMEIEENKKLKQECEELKKQLDKYLNQEEEEIRQLNNDNKLDDILSAIEKANDKMEKESNYKQALDEIESSMNAECNACKKFTPNRQSKIACSYCHPTQILNIINKAKEH